MSSTTTSNVSANSQEILYFITTPFLEIQKFLKKIDNIGISVDFLKKEPYKFEIKFDNNNIEESNYFLICPSKGSDKKEIFTQEVCHGIIFDTKNYNVIYWNGANEFDGLSELNISGESPFQEKQLVDTFKEGRWNLFEYIEGSLIKVYYNEYTKTWNVGTSKSLNAYNVFHLSKTSLGEYFEQEYKRSFVDTNIYSDNFQELLKNTLNENCSYSFVLSIPNINTVFDSHKKSQLQQVSKFNYKNSEFYINYKSAYNFSTLNKMQSFFEDWKTSDDMLKKNFILVHTADKSETDNSSIKIKIMNPEYQKYSTALHDTKTNSLLKRYIELRDSPDKMLMISCLSEHTRKVYSQFNLAYDQLMVYLLDLYTSVYKYKNQLSFEDPVELKTTKFLLYRIHKKFAEKKKLFNGNQNNYDLSVNLIDIYHTMALNECTGAIIKLLRFRNGDDCF